MASPTVEPISIVVGESLRVSGLLLVPAPARACYVLAHGAGAGMNHPFMAAVATGLAGRSIATLRYQFPYMERGNKRPDPPKLAHAAVRAVFYMIQGFVRQAKCSYVICQGSLSKDLSSPIQWKLLAVISVKRHRVFRPRESSPIWTMSLPSARPICRE